MLSHLKPAFGHIPADMPDPVRQVVACRGNFARAANKLWMAMDNPEWVPDFSPHRMQRAPRAHPDLYQRIGALKLLPAWNSSVRTREDSQLFGKINAQQQFSRLLGQARILAQELHSVWGETDALSMLQLVGPDLVVEAYDRGDDFALSACAVAYTLIEADRAVRACLGAVVADEMQAVDVLSQIGFTRYRSDTMIGTQTAQEMQGAFPTTVVYNNENSAVLNVQINHPQLRPTSLLGEVIGLYRNKRILHSFKVEDIAVLLKEPLSAHHLAAYFTLSLGPVQRVYNLIDDTVPDPVFMSVDWGKCKYAFEQCCRYFGEDFMMENVFGQNPSTTHRTLFNEKLMKILPVLQRFLRGDETSWC